MQTYTVKQVKPTGAVDPQYGTEYIVQFDGDERIVTVNRKSEPQVGDSWEGEITVNKWGTKFKKAPFVPGQQASAAGAPSGSIFVPDTKPAYKDNSDGMRQGMCFNNAAAYINASKAGAIVDSPEDWATQVHKYAAALYQLGDLNNEAVVVTGDEDVKTVLDAFGPGKVA